MPGFTLKSASSGVEDAWADEEIGAAADMQRRIFFRNFIGGDGRMGGWEK
jgi:hypothetical protein